MTHTPGPWMTVRDRNYSSGYAFIVWGPKGPGYGAICDVSPHGQPAYQEEIDRKEADAAYIVRAANCFDELLAACKHALNHPITDAWTDHLKQLIARCESQP